GTRRPTASSKISSAPICAEPDGAPRRRAPPRTRRRRDARGAASAADDVLGALLGAVDDALHEPGLGLVARALDAEQLDALEAPGDGGLHREGALPVLGELRQVVRVDLEGHVGGGGRLVRGVHLPTSTAGETAAGASSRRGGALFQGHPTSSSSFPKVSFDA